MNREAIHRFETELKVAYAGATSAIDGNRTLVKLPEVTFPEGCSLSTSAALVVLDPGADRPEFYLASIPTLQSGLRPPVGAVLIAGETWNSYSYAVHKWTAESNTAVQFVEAKLRRFSLAQ